MELAAGQRVTSWGEGGAGRRRGLASALCFAVVSTLRALIWVPRLGCRLERWLPGASLGMWVWWQPPVPAAQWHSICDLLHTCARLTGRWRFSAVALGEASPRAFRFSAPALMGPSWGGVLFSGWGCSHIPWVLTGPGTLFSLSFLRFNIHLLDRIVSTRNWPVEVRTPSVPERGCIWRRILTDAVRSRRDH